MQAVSLWRRAATQLGRAAAAFSTLGGPELAGAARLGAPLLPPSMLTGSAAASGLPWHAACSAAAAAAARQQPVSLSQAAASLSQAAAVPAAAPLRAPAEGGLLRQLETLWADSVRRKRKRAMNKHKHRKRRKLNRMSSRK